MSEKKTVFKHNEFQIMQEAWTIYRENYEPKNTDEYWNRVVDSFKELIKKYDSKFCSALCDFFLMDLQNRA